MVGQRTQPATQAQLNAAARAIIGGAGVQDGPLRGLSMEDFDRATDLANQMKAGAMDEDFETEEQSAELPAEAMDLQALVATNPALAAYMRKYEADIDAADAARQRKAKISKDVFEKGEKEILARRYGAPTTSEQLFALSAALLAPRRYTGFAGTLDKIAPVLGQMDKLQSSAEAQRNEARDRLRREYLTGVADADVAAAQARVEARGKLLSPLVSATKPRVPRIVGTAIIDGVPHQGEQDPVTGVVRWAPINPEAQGAVLPQLTAPQRNSLAKLQTYISNPNVPEDLRQAALRNFQTKFKVNPLDYMKGAM